LIGVIAGTASPKGGLLNVEEEKLINTPYGDARLNFGSEVVFINRHWESTPPHMINHKANIWALKKYCEHVIGILCVGSLKKHIIPGSLIVPSDYICLEPATFYDREIRHITPELDVCIRRDLITASERSGYDIIEEGVYVQTRGPRLETKAEVCFWSGFADVIGMTMASEATLAQELGLKYAGICSVDNFANGLGDKRLEFECISLKASESAIKIEKILSNMLGELI
jgi:5'-methylthioadenosine phosphorylase